MVSVGVATGSSCSSMRAGIDVESFAATFRAGVGRRVAGVGPDAARELSSRPGRDSTLDDTNGVVGAVAGAVLWEE